MKMKKNPFKKPAARGSQRAKIIISGKAGVGKTVFAMQFPGVAFIDVEGSAEREWYADQLQASGASYFGRDDGSQDIAQVINLVKWLATNKHDFKTVVIDSFSKLYSIEAARCSKLKRNGKEIGTDFGADRREANKQVRILFEWIDKLDMNVILICHSKQDYLSETNETTFDGMNLMDHELDLWIEVILQGTEKRLIRVRKQRLQGFKLNEKFPLDFEAFAKKYGQQHLNASVTTIETAPEALTGRLTALVREAGIGQGTVDKWLQKAKVQQITELPEDVVKSCIQYCEGRLNGTGAA